MESLTWYVVIAVLLLGFVIGAGIALIRGRGSTTSAPAKPRPGIDYAPGVGDDDSVPRDTPRRSVTDVPVSVLDEPETHADSVDAVWEVETPEPTKGRLHRLRERLARSNNALSKGLLSLLARDDVDEDTWEQVEEILLTADLGVAATTELMDRLRSRIQVEGARDAESVRSLLRDELLALVDPTMDRGVTTKADGRPAVILVVGVNGTGKTTTSGQLARVLVADGRTVLLAAADTDNIHGLDSSKFSNVSSGTRDRLRLQLLHLRCRCVCGGLRCGCWRQRGWRRRGWRWRWSRRGTASASGRWRQPKAWW